MAKITVLTFHICNSDQYILLMVKITVLTFHTCNSDQYIPLMAKITVLTFHTCNSDQYIPLMAKITVLTFQNCNFDQYIPLMTLFLTSISSSLMFPSFLWRMAAPPDVCCFFIRFQSSHGHNHPLILPPSSLYQSLQLNIMSIHSIQTHPPCMLKPCPSNSFYLSQSKHFLLACWSPVLLTAATYPNPNTSSLHGEAPPL